MTILWSGLPLTGADDGDYSGGGDVLRNDGEAIEGVAYGRVSFLANNAYDETASGPALQSAVFSAYEGEQLNVDWRIIPEGACNGNLGGGDVGLALGQPLFFRLQSIAPRDSQSTLDRQPLISEPNQCLAKLLI